MKSTCTVCKAEGVILGDVKQDDYKWMECLFRVNGKEICHDCLDGEIYKKEAPNMTDKGGVKPKGVVKPSKDEKKMTEKKLKAKPKKKKKKKKKSTKK